MIAKQLRSTWQVVTAAPAGTGHLLGSSCPVQGGWEGSPNSPVSPARPSLGCPEKVTGWLQKSPSCHQVEQPPTPVPGVREGQGCPSGVLLVCHLGRAGFQGPTHSSEMVRGHSPAQVSPSPEAQAWSARCREGVQTPEKGLDRPSPNNLLVTPSEWSRNGHFNAENQDNLQMNHRVGPEEGARGCEGKRWGP